MYLSTEFKVTSRLLKLLNGNKFNHRMKFCKKCLVVAGSDNIIFFFI